MCYWKNNWEPLDGHVYHFRDSNGLECDTVLHRNNGTYGLIEVKIGGDTNIEEGAANLLSLVSKIDTDKMPEPSFMMVLTAVGEYAYRRKDGVFVVPIGCLKPWRGKWDYAREMFPNEMVKMHHIYHTRHPLIAQNSRYRP